MKTSQTETLYIVQGYYQGWEDLTASTTRKEARDDCKAYRENAPGAYRVIARRCWKGTGEAYREPR